MIKKENIKDGKKQLIYYENIIYVESSEGRQDFILGWFNREDVGKLFKQQDILLQINGLGDKENEDTVNIQDGVKYKIILKRIEDEEE